MVGSGAAEAHGLSVAWVADSAEAVLTVRGTVDFASCHVLEGAVREVLAREVHQVLVDLDAVTLLDSAGIRTLDAGWRLATTRGAGFQVTHVRGLPKEVLSITGLLDRLTRP